MDGMEARGQSRQARRSSLDLASLRARLERVKPERVLHRARCPAFLEARETAPLPAVVLRAE